MRDGACAVRVSCRSGGVTGARVGVRGTCLVHDCRQHPLRHFIIFDFNPLRDHRVHVERVKFKRTTISHWQSMVSHMRMYASLRSTSSSDTLVTTSSSNLNHGDFFDSAEAAFLPLWLLRCALDSDSACTSATLSGMPRQ